MATFRAEILVQAPPQDDIAAFRAWMQPYEGRVYGLALRMTGNAQDAEWVLIETFVKAGRQFARRAESERDFQWLARLAVRESLCVARASCGDLAGWINDQCTPLEGRARTFFPWVEQPAELFAPQQWRRILEAALTILSPMDRAVFVLREMEKFTESQVAALLSIEVFDVRLRLNRAHISLRDRLDPICRVGARLAPRPRLLANQRLGQLAPRRDLRRIASLQP